MKYTKNLTLDEILKDNPDNVTILMGFGMHCLGCPMSRNETLEQACEAHNLDLGFVLDSLNGEKKNDLNSTENENKNK